MRSAYFCCEWTVSAACLGLRALPRSLLVRRGPATTSSLAHILIPGAITTDFLSALDCAIYCTPTIRFLLMPTILMSARCSLVVLNHHRLRLNALSCTLFPLPSSPSLMILFLVNYLQLARFSIPVQQVALCTTTTTHSFFLFFLVTSAPLAKFHSSLCTY
jgi:hypothetical protein